MGLRTGGRGPCRKGWGVEFEELLGSWVALCRALALCPTRPPREPAAPLNPVLPKGRLTGALEAGSPALLLQGVGCHFNTVIILLQLPRNTRAWRNASSGKFLPSRSASHSSNLLRKEKCI